MSILNSDVRHQYYFEELTKIPHGSGNEKAISDYIVSVAESLKLDYYQDDVYNVVIYKKASEGYENHPAVMLQAHIDMVCEKDPSSNHDFEKDPLPIYVEDGYLKSKGTTLGADDGAGVAYMLAILEDNNLKHPALECLFTVSEETTMLGANSLDVTKLQARKLINLDGEEEGYTMTSSCGGIDVVFNHETVVELQNEKGYELVVSGLSGGHSGGEIHKEKGNAMKIIARILYKASKCGELSVSEMYGGSKINAIPRDAYARFIFDGDFEKVIENEVNDIKKELEETDNGLKIEVHSFDIENTMGVKESKQLVSLLYVLPNGLLHKSELQKNLTTSSCNLGILRVKEGQIHFEISVRGALRSYYEDTADVCIELASAYGYEAHRNNGYPCWDYIHNSELRDVMNQVHNEVYGKDIEMIGVHGGLECGVFKTKLPDLDIVTMGPNAADVHSPTERMELKSFDTTYNFLVKFIEKL